MFVYLSKVVFSGFLQFKGYFVRGKNESKYRDWAPLLPRVVLMPKVIPV